MDHLLDMPLLSEEPLPLPASLLHVSQVPTETLDPFAFAQQATPTLIPPYPYRPHIRSQPQNPSAHTTGPFPSLDLSPSRVDLPGSRSDSPTHSHSSSRSCSPTPSDDPHNGGLWTNLAAALTQWFSGSRTERQTISHPDTLHPDGSNPDRFNPDRSNLVNSHQQPLSNPPHDHYDPPHMEVNAIVSADRLSCLDLIDAPFGLETPVDCDNRPGLDSSSRQSSSSRLYSSVRRGSSFSQDAILPRNASESLLPPKPRTADSLPRLANLVAPQADSIVYIDAQWSDLSADSSDHAESASQADSLSRVAAAPSSYSDRSDFFLLSNPPDSTGQCLDLDPLSDRIREDSFEAYDGILLSVSVFESENAFQQIPIATVFVLHTFLADRRSLLPAAKRFAAAGFRVVLYDARGHGSSEGVRARCMAVELILDLAGIVEKFQIADIPNIVYGHGLGATVAISLCHQLASLKEDSDKASTSTGSWDSLSSDWRLHENYDPSLASFANFGNLEIDAVIATNPWLRPISETLLGRSFASVDNPRKRRSGFFSMGSKADGLSNMAEDFSVRALNNSLSQAWDMGERCMASKTEVKVPILLIHGDKDQYASHTATQEYFENYPSSDKTLHIWAGAEHEPTFEELDEFLSLSVVWSFHQARVIYQKRDAESRGDFEGHDAEGTPQGGQGDSLINSSIQEQK
eukprot:TRINITY_DN10839_c0_g1_i1.p1 TRINITY_DN10839_c0_g1~~TRINITY_DN10839_c0_g1_i1.p1  ORF type:complete len:689 (+),score=119.96 TRINITY_DN10839_c0_g1_i1:53-2119(+)